MSKNVISLERFSDFHDEVRGVEIRSHLNLPEYVPTSEAQVDIGRIATVSRIGRLESVNFKLFDGESGGGSATIAGVNHDGSAVAAKVRSRSVARSVSDSYAHASRMDFPKGLARIKVNSSHTDMDDKPLRDIEPWSELIDKGLRDGMKDSVRRQLLREHMPDRIAELAIAGSVSGGFVVFSNFPVTAAAGGMAFAALRVPSFFFGKDLERKLTPGFPIDRYAVARSILATRKIVKPT